MKLTVYGGRRLFGEVSVDGAKNAYPLLAATLLTDEDVVLQNIPNVGDVRLMIRLLECLGKRVERLNGKVYAIRAEEPLRAYAPEHLVKKLRASFCVLGPLVARVGLAQVALPGGCPIGVRPVDLHVKGLRALGVEVESVGGVFQARTETLHPAEIHLDYPSVGATEQIMMTAALVPGRTVISNPAQEPEVHDLARLLIKMGAGIMIEPGRLIIEGVKRLQGTAHTIIPDRIAAGTFLIAGAIAGGDVTVHCQSLHMEALLSKLDELGFEVQERVESVRIVSEGPGSYTGGRVEARPYPGFPTDLQPQTMALLGLARGTSIIKDTVFENRFAHAAEMTRMGAHIRIEGLSALIEGVEGLEGTSVRVHDIREGAALILAGLAAHGTTIIMDSDEHIARGYCDVAGELSGLGAAIMVEDEQISNDNKEVVSTEIR